ncbi:RRC1-like protein isoform X1 [Tanacetum coccineum]
MFDYTMCQDIILLMNAYYGNVVGTMGVTAMCNWKFNIVQGLHWTPQEEEECTKRSHIQVGHVETERTLTDAQRDEFEDMMRDLTLERIIIKEAMGFALDNVDAAREIVEVLTESLTLKKHRRQ